MSMDIPNEHVAEFFKNIPKRLYEMKSEVDYYGIRKYISKMVKNKHQPIGEVLLAGNMDGIITINL